MLQKIDEKQAGAVVRDLREELNRHNYYYYIKDNPIISDADYDKLMRLLKSMEEKFPSW
ncbi:MAG: hypothetical protein U5N58_06600 [Actinomycetota bacterium]|nr:hypothetical protein [Actinomycetota bacterium]